MSQAPQTDESNGSPPQTSDANTHLAQLHRMSPTAGVTNRGYVALNLLAIVAVLLGLASALALLSFYFLPIPVGAIVVALLAMRQVNNSNGTQTGKGLALAGLGLAVILGGAVGAMEWKNYAALKEDESRISATLSEAGKQLHDGKYDQAYALFDDSFKSYVTPELFKSNMISVQAPRGLGKLESMAGNGIVQFESANGARPAITKAIIKFANIRGEDERFDVALREVGGKWMIVRFPFFAEPKKGGADDFIF